MRKKIFTIFLALVVGAGTIYAQSFTAGYLEYGYSNDTKTATVPKKIQDFNKVVTSIGGEENDISSCAEAAEAALSVSANNVLYNNGKVYTIEGYVTAIAAAWSSTYKNISFWMADTQNGGKVLEAFRAVCKNKSDSPQIGDKVRVTGALTKYGSIPEFAAGCTFEIIYNIGSSSLGMFTIADNIKVRFAPGNLQYQPSTDTWRFAEHQYDVTHLSAADVTMEYEGWIDEFTWSYDQFSDIGCSRGHCEFDWGGYSIINGGNKPNAWFTLKDYDWKEIFVYRKNADNLWGCGTINGIEGIIILPDNWALPQGLIFNAGVKKGLAPYVYPDDGSAVPVWYDGVGYDNYYYNPNRDNFKHNTYSIEDWQKMAKAGAIFLPSEEGGYWTGFASDDNAESVAWCGDDFLVVCRPFDTRGNTHFVRLVQDINYTDDLEETKDDAPINAKVIRNGQLFILRDGKMYTVQGQEVR